MDESAAPTSLQRFVGGRGRDYVDFKPVQTGQVLKHTWLSIAIMPAAIILVALLTSGQDFTIRLFAVPVAMIVTAPLTPLLMTRQMRSMMQKIVGDRTTPITLSNGVSVTPAAQEMVMMLHWHYWSRYPGAEEAYKKIGELAKKHRAVQAQQNMLLTGAMRAKSAQELAGAPKQVLELLEQAAFQYNRSAGLVESLGLTDVGPDIVKGADEAMVVVLHQARQIIKYPESLSALEGRFTASVETLRELADSVEALTALHGSAPTVALGDLLQDLRLKLAALGELSSPDVGGNITDRPR